MTLLGNIVNSKRKQDEKLEMDEVNLSRKIEKRNSLKQEMKIIDEQESYRLLWLTYWQQLLNYKKWEEYCVCLGIAHLPTDESEQLKKGHIAFLEGQEHRYI